MKIQHALASAVSALLSTTAFADVTVTNTTQLNTGFTVSNADLLQSNLASTQFTGSFQQENALGTSAFTNGIFGTQGNQGGYIPAGTSQAATADGSNVAIFTLDNGTGAGYNINTINTYAGWDNYRGGQSYTVSYATVAAPTTFVTLASVFNDATGSGNVNTWSSIVNSTGGFLATNVQSLRFAFGGDLTYGYAGYREIDVLGSAVTAVPEPGTLPMLLAGFGVLGLVARRRRSQG